MKKNSIRFLYLKRASKLLLYIERWLAQTGEFLGRLKLSRDYMNNVDFEVRIQILYDDIRPVGEM